jgi:hypothetical protein
MYKKHLTHQTSRDRDQRIAKRRKPGQFIFIAASSQQFPPNPFMPANPPITDGLSVWLCSDTNVDMRPDGSVVLWGVADGSGLQAAAIGSSRPQLLSGQINGYPVLRFSGTQGLFLETGFIAQDSFTLIAVGRSFESRADGGSGLSGQKMVFYQDGSPTLTHAAVSVGVNGVGIYEFGNTDAPRAEVDADAACFCPLVVRYEGKYLSVYLSSSNVINNSNPSSQPLDAPHGIGGTGGDPGGFVGDIAEVLIYNRALSDWERQMVEQYVQNKYACGPSSSSSSEDSSSSSSSEESSWSSEWSSEWSSDQSSDSPSSSSSSDYPSSDSSSSDYPSSDSSSSDYPSSDSSSSDYPSSDSSSSSSSDDSSSSSSSCSCQMPSDPVPVTDGLVAWQRSDLNLNTDGNGQVTTWGPVCDCLPNAARMSSNGPLVVGGSFGAYPGVQFTLGDAQQLSLEGGELGSNNFTLFLVARPEAERVWNGSGTNGQRLLLSDDDNSSSTHVALSAGLQSLAVYEYQNSGNPRLEAVLAGCLCPVVVRYENKQAALYVSGALVAQDTAQPWYDIYIPHNIGGLIRWDSGTGFVGELAELIFYNRALSDYERQLVELYVQNRYGCLSSSSSSSEDSSSSSDESSWSSEWSSEWSSDQSSDSPSSSDTPSSSEESSSSSDEQSSEWSSDQSSEQSSAESASSCSPVLPPNPVPVTDGLVAWQRADQNVNRDGNNQVTIWGGADGCLPEATRVTFVGPIWQATSFGSQPAVAFTGSEGLQLQSIAELASNSFTLVVAACPDALNNVGSLFGPGNIQTGAVAAVAANIEQVNLSEPGGNSGVRLSTVIQGCLCPLTIIYDNKQARIYWQGTLMAQDTNTPPYDIWVPKLIGGTGSGGFVGRVAEVLFYNRALSNNERQDVEQYLQNRYQCLSSSSDSSDSSASSGSSDSSEDSSGGDESSSSSSSSSSSYSSEQQSSEDSSYSSESSESSGGTISFLDSEAYLTNPGACDFNERALSISNTTGREIAYVEISTSGGNRSPEAGDDPKPPYTIVKYQNGKLTLKAVADVGIAGEAVASGTFEFKDVNKELISTASIELGVEQTLKNALTVLGQSITVNFSEQIAVEFMNAGRSYGFTDISAPQRIADKVSGEFTNQSESIKASMNVSFVEQVNALSQDVNKSLELGYEASWTFISLDFGTVFFNASGNGKATWTSDSINKVFIDLGIGCTLGNINFKDRKLDGNLWMIKINTESKRGNDQLEMKNDSIKIYFQGRF